MFGVVLPNYVWGDFQEWKEALGRCYIFNRSLFFLELFQALLVFLTSDSTGRCHVRPTNPRWLVARVFELDPELLMLLILFIITQCDTLTWLRHNFQCNWIALSRLRVELCLGTMLPRVIMGNPQGRYRGIQSGTDTSVHNP